MSPLQTPTESSWGSYYNKKVTGEENEVLLQIREDTAGGFRVSRGMRKGNRFPGKRTECDGDDLGGGELLEVTGRERQERSFAERGGLSWRRKRKRGGGGLEGGVRASVGLRRAERHRPRAGTL